MQEYVCGFLFSPDRRRVLLIRKRRPAWQAGKLNGVGGKVEPGETVGEALRREFREEAGLDVADWRRGVVLTGPDWRGHFFRAFGDIDAARAMTDEPLERHPTDGLPPDVIARSIAEVGVGFMFAPNHHPAMKNVAPVRRELGIKTIFNILGPLTNPASAPNILMGVFHPDLVGIQVRALQRLGAEHAVVVYGRDGMDEVSLGAATMVGELKNGEIAEYEIHPEDFGLTMASSRALRVETPEDSKAMLLGVLENRDDPVLKAARDIVALNAGVALYAANVGPDMAQGIALARRTLESGAAAAKLRELQVFTQSAVAGAGV